MTRVIVKLLLSGSIKSLATLGREGRFAFMEVVDIISMPIEAIKLLLLHRWIATSLGSNAIAPAAAAAADRNTLGLTEQRRISCCFNSAKSRHGAWEIVRVATNAGLLGSRDKQVSRHIIDFIKADLFFC